MINVYNYVRLDFSCRVTQNFTLFVLLFIAKYMYKYIIPRETMLIFAYMTEYLLQYFGRVMRLGMISCGTE